MNHNILYSFRRCPFAIRARWAILNTNQNVELREVDLKNKPKELIKISPKATVPVLETCLNEIIDESLDIMIWSIKNANMQSLLVNNNNNMMQEIFSLIEINDNIFKYHLDRFKYASRFNYKDLEVHKEAGMEILLSLNKRLKTSSQEGKSLFLIGEKETLADWAIWPFVRQFRIANVLEFDQNKELKFLQVWLNYFFSHEKYPITMKKYSPWNKNREPIFLG